MSKMIALITTVCFLVVMAVLATPADLNIPEPTLGQGPGITQG